MIPFEHYKLAKDIIVDNVKLSMDAPDDMLGPIMLSAIAASDTAAFMAIAVAIVARYEAQNQPTTVTE